MGNICSSNQISPLRSECLKEQNSTEFELFYSPALGEGETIKVILSYMDIPLKEHISHSDASQIVKIAVNKRVVHGTFESLRYICKYFGLYPIARDSTQLSEKICVEILETWRHIRDAFYCNDRCRIHHFYFNKLVALLERIEKIIDENSSGIFEDKVSMVDFLVLTLIYNLFFNKRQEQYKKLLDDHAPKLTNHCYSLLSSHSRISNYFHTRPFNLYI